METRKNIRFNEDMEKDVQAIKNYFLQTYRYYPSNKQIFAMLLTLWKEKQFKIEQNNKKKRNFTFRI
jgi:hypothetical protein